MLLYQGGEAVFHFLALDIGGLAVFVNYSRQFSRPINEIAQQVTNIMSALAGAERVFDVMDNEPEHDRPGAVELKNVKGDVVYRRSDFRVQSQIKQY